MCRHNIEWSEFTKTSDHPSSILIKALLRKLDTPAIGRSHVHVVDVPHALQVRRQLALQGMRSVHEVGVRQVQDKLIILK